MQKKKYRVYELAKEFGKTDKEVIEILKAGHVDVTNRLSGVDDNGKSILARHVAAEKKKAAKRPVMRTVRFDQAGQPRDLRSVSHRHWQGNDALVLRISAFTHASFIGLQERFLACARNDDTRV